MAFWISLPHTRTLVSRQSWCGGRACVRVCSQGSTWPLEKSGSPECPRGSQSLPTAPCPPTAPAASEWPTPAAATASLFSPQWLRSAGLALQPGAARPAFSLERVSHQWASRWLWARTGELWATGRLWVTVSARPMGSVLWHFPPGSSPHLRQQPARPRTHNSQARHPAATHRWRLRTHRLCWRASLLELHQCGGELRPVQLALVRQNDWLRCGERFERFCVDAGFLFHQLCSSSLTVGGCARQRGRWRCRGLLVVLLLLLAGGAGCDFAVAQTNGSNEYPGHPEAVQQQQRQLLPTSASASWLFSGAGAVKDSSMTLPSPRFNRLRRPATR